MNRWGFALVLCMINATAIAQWPVEFKAGLFQVHADFEPQSLQSPEISNSLSALPGEIESLLGIHVSANEVHLILFRRAEDYRNYMQRYFPGVAARQAMFIRRSGPGMVFAFNSPQLATDLRHESTHALLNATLPYVPLWMDEGIAEYFEAASSDRLNGHPHQSNIFKRMRFSRAPEVSQLENIDTLAKMDGDAYRDAWSIVHFLIHESPQSRAVLQRFLQELQAHAPPGQFSRRLDAELPDWRTRYVQHFRQRG